MAETTEKALQENIWIRGEPGGWREESVERLRREFESFGLGLEGDPESVLGWVTDIEIDVDVGLINFKAGKHLVDPARAEVRLQKGEVAHTVFLFAFKHSPREDFPEVTREETGKFSGITRVVFPSDPSERFIRFYGDFYGGGEEGFVQLNSDRTIEISVGGRRSSL